MKKLYQRTFEQVLAQTCPPLNRVEEQRRALASRCSHTESEVTATVSYTHLTLPTTSRV